MHPFTQTRNLEMQSKKSTTSITLIITGMTFSAFSSPCYLFTSQQILCLYILMLGVNSKIYKH